MEHDRPTELSHAKVDCAVPPAVKCPRQGTNQKGTGATSSFATRTRDQWGVLRRHDPLDSANALVLSGELIIR